MEIALNTVVEQNPSLNELPGNPCRLRNQILHVVELAANIAPCAPAPQNKYLILPNSRLQSSYVPKDRGKIEIYIKYEDVTAFEISSEILIICTI